MRVLILGAGSSGQSAKKFLTAQGHDVMLYDDTKNALFRMPHFSICDFDMCVLSPGVSKNHPLAKNCSDKLISELDLGFSVPHKKVVAVTGTNGKTTVVNMLHRAIGDTSVLCGNVGVPVTSVADKLATKTAVVEVSSFQLEIPPKHFKPDIGILLNIAEDHLDRHVTMEEYTQCKMRIAGDVTILNYDDEILRNVTLSRSDDGVVLYFSIKEPVLGIYLDGDDIMLNLDDKPRRVFSIADFGAPAPHDVQNILATALACFLLRVPKSNILSACTAPREPHRIEYVATIDGTQFFNDSKATNVASCLAACRSFKKPINLIVGGVGKGQNFTALFAQLPPHVKNVFVIGESTDEILEAHRTSKNSPFCKGCTTLPQAIKLAFEKKPRGATEHVVLLSPACASFDMFRDYKDRGEQFKNEVAKLKSTR